MTAYFEIPIRKLSKNFNNTLNWNFAILPIEILQYSILSIKFLQYNQIVVSSELLYRTFLLLL